MIAVIITGAGATLGALLAARFGFQGHLPAERRRRAGVISLLLVWLTLAITGVIAYFFLL